MNPDQPAGTLSVEEFAEVFRHIPVAAAVTRAADGRIIEINDAFCRLAGFSREESIGRSTVDLGIWVQSADRQSVVDEMRRSGRVRDMDMPFRERDGSVRRMLISMESMDIGGVACIVSTAVDVTESRRAESALAESENRFRRFTSMTSDVFYSCFRGDDGLFRVDWLGGDAARVFGCDVEELKALGCWRGFVLPDDQPLFANAITGLRPGESSDAIMRVRHRNGAVHYVRSYSHVDSNPDLADRHRLYGAIQDVTDRIELEQRLERQAHIDYLTGLFNRGYFLELAEKELARVRRYGSPMSLAVLDLDHFKAINDTYGHEVGDKVLREFARVCRRTLRESDLMGRMGGEEFAIVFPETTAEHAFDVAERLREEIAAAAVPMERGLPIRVTTSIGMATVGENDVNIDVMLNRADRALYEAKRGGRNRTCEAAHTG